MTLLRRVSTPTDAVAVIGAGTSSLITGLLAAGYRRIHAVDISQPALDRLRTGLGSASVHVQFHVADVRELTLSEQVDVWHDRATFHFLVEPGDRARYVRRAAAAVPVGGHLVLATFASDGPAQCSGLDVCRYSATSLATELAPDFEVLTAFDREHHTPWGARQVFLHAIARRTWHSTNPPPDR